MKLAVAGGTGTVGTHVVDVAREHGHEVVVLTRSNGVDLLTGAGLAEALAGVEVVIDTSNITTLSAAKAVAFFTTATRTLLAAERAAGVRHHVALSIVGVDRAPYDYYAGKLAQERAVEGQTDVPWTIQRTTQFHEFAGQMLAQLSFGPFHVVPSIPSAPVAAREVAERLVALAEGGAVGRARDLGGPRDERLPDMVRGLVRRTGVRGPVIPVVLPTAQLRAMRRGAAMPDADADRSAQTFEEWLAAEHPQRP
ncbi:NAD-dependent epimerase/dehydratase family protein [Agromyces protaetiae]|uniref:NAD-dependent epimerase/dehydratase family protein n=1 Tax=Agromyces protaetiae TaxID=2509455 RepID=A0A4P6F8C5_9MICO|nr:NAD(P)H-binding protein [Agromyces protaetiae]QAY71994.1 NAD-dependent epimerase/dehydratase family protein [Agromyces protaetiae]